jgi:hypothetical protein
VATLGDGGAGTVTAGSGPVPAGELCAP